MSVNSDDFFEIPSFLIGSAKQRGVMRLPRVTQLGVAPAQDASEDTEPAPQAAARFASAPQAPLTLKSFRSGRSGNIAMVSAALVGAAIVVAFGANQGFDVLRRGGAAAIAEARTSLGVDAGASPHSSSESAVFGANPPAPEWSAEAARLQQDAPAAAVVASTSSPDATVVASTAATAAESAAAPPLAPAIDKPMPERVANIDPVVHGLNDQEIRFGMVSPFSGANKESGRQLKLGVDAAFAAANEAGGVNGRQLKLLAADDGYEPTHTLDAVQDLYNKGDVFGFIGNFGTVTAAAALPFTLNNHALFLGALSGANLLRRDPPDRYVFNYRPSYAEETDAAVRYLIRVRRIPPNNIAVFTQQDAFGDAGYEGVTTMIRSLPNEPEPLLRLNYKRNTVEVDDAVNQLRAQRGRIKAIVMVATYRAAAKFIEKTRDAFPQMIYTNVSAVGATSLADELMLLGPRFANGVVVTQVTPAVNSSASFVLKYKAALAKYFPGEAPDYTSLESYIDANILIDALKRAGRQVDSEKLVDAMESTRDLDMGLGTVLRYNSNEHQASHKVWGTQLDEAGHFQPIDLE